MGRNINRRTRDRYLTSEEAARYNHVREQVEAEKSEIAARLKARLNAMSAAQQVFQQLKEAHETKGSVPGANDGLSSSSD